MTALKVGDYIRPVDEETRGIIRRIDRGIYYVELEDDSSSLHRYSARELRKLEPVEHRSKTLPDGTKLNVEFHGKPGKV